MQIVGERDVESRFQFHYEFNPVQRVESEFVEVVVYFKIDILTAEFLDDFVSINVSNAEKSRSNGKKVVFPDKINASWFIIS